MKQRHTDILAGGGAMLAAWLAFAGSAQGVRAPGIRVPQPAHAGAVQPACTVDLRVAGTATVGEVSTAWPDQSNLVVRYRITDGYTRLRATHLFIVARDPGGTLQLYSFVHDWLACERDEFVVPLASLGLGAPTCVVFTVHADVDEPTDFLAVSNADAFAAMVPASNALMVVGDRAGADAYLKVELAGACGLNGVHDDWCIDTDREIAAGDVYRVNLYSSYAVLPTGLVEFAGNLDEVNYVMNHHFIGRPSAASGNYTFGDVQRALWALVEDVVEGEGTDPWDQTRVDEIVADAQSHGDGFVPDCGGTFALILDPVDADGNTVAQVTFIEVPVHCAPQLKRADAWGIGPAGWNGKAPYLLCCP